MKTISVIAKSFLNSAGLEGCGWRWEQCSMEEGSQLDFGTKKSAFQVPGCGGLGQVAKHLRQT